MSLSKRLILVVTRESNWSVHYKQYLTIFSFSILKNWTCGLLESFRSLHWFFETFCGWTEMHTNTDLSVWRVQVFIWLSCVSLRSPGLNRILHHFQLAGVRGGSPLQTLLVRNEARTKITLHALYDLQEKLPTQIPTRTASPSSLPQSHHLPHQAWCGPETGWQTLCSD